MEEIKAPKREEMLSEEIEGIKNPVIIISNIE